MDITVEKLAKAKSILNINALVREALPPGNYTRLYSKVQRQSPELTPEESKAIGRTLKKYGVNLQ